MDKDQTSPKTPISIDDLARLTQEGFAELRGSLSDLRSEFTDLRSEVSNIHSELQGIKMK